MIDLDNIPEVSAQSARFQVNLEWIGEGYDGDYDAEDPEDAPLYRLDVAEWTEDPEDREDPDEPWVHVESVCTQVRADCGRAKAQEVADFALALLDGQGGSRPRRLVELLSWTTLDAETGAVRNPQIRDEAAP